MTRKCAICLDDFAPEGKRILRSAKVCRDLKCGHMFCKPCIGEYARRAILDGKATFGQLPCPVEGCTVPLEDFMIRRLVSAEDRDRHTFFLQQRMIDEDDNVRRCPAPNCGKVFGIAAGATEVECPRCHRVFCVSCGLRSHPGSSCETICDAAYGQWKANKGVKPCPGCMFHTEKNGGCNHIRCSRCLTEWCYECGKRPCTCFALTFPEHRIGAPQPRPVTFFHPEESDE